MRCYIDGMMFQERYFWLRVDNLATRDQKVRILDGSKVKISESIYWIETDE